MKYKTDRQETKKRYLPWTCRKCNNSFLFLPFNHTFNSFSFIANGCSLLETYKIARVYDILRNHKEEILPQKQKEKNEEILTQKQAKERNEMLK